MKKYLIFLTLILTIIVLTLLFFVNRSSTISKKEINFAIDDTASIVKIFLADKEGNTVLLERSTQNIWYVNNYLAQKDVINNFLRTLMYVTVRAPVSLSARDNVIRHMASFGVKVEIYQKKFFIDLPWLQLFPRIKKTRCYYVGDNTQDNSGTYMIMENSQNPYITYIPGFYGFLHSRYSTNLFDWRDHTVFNHLLTDIKEVELIHKQNFEKSFRIENIDNKNFQVVDLITNKPIDNIDTLRVISYLNGFYDTRFEYFIKNNLLMDSLLKIEPFYNLTLISKQNDTIEIKAYLKPNEYDKEQLEARFFDTSDYPWDRERMWAIVGNPPELVAIQYFVFGRLWKPIDFFRKGYREKILEDSEIH